jgi:hypothetical protein
MLDLGLGGENGWTGELCFARGFRAYAGSGEAKWRMNASCERKSRIVSDSLPSLSNARSSESVQDGVCSPVVIG